MTRITDEIQCPVCGYYCLGKGGHGCIDKPALTELGRLIAGEQYERRDGTIVTTQRNPFQMYATAYPFVADGHTYTETGKYRSDSLRPQPLDLIRAVDRPDDVQPIVYPCYTVTQLYHELLYSVSHRHPGESLHKTALRYIRQADCAEQRSAELEAQIVALKEENNVLCVQGNLYLAAVAETADAETFQRISETFTNGLEPEELAVATLERVRALPGKWKNTAMQYTHEWSWLAVDCADELQAALEPQEKTP